ncbi:MAG: BON domain-containing protein [Chloroflexi bacterium]|nr:BON domain-containing protein [Chloroflexota bacterium]
MAALDFHIGAKVQCKDGQCGTLNKVIVNPDTAEVTDIVVEKGFLLKDDLVVPVTAVESADGEEVRLSIDSEQLKEHPVYNATQFTIPEPDAAVPPGFKTGDFMYWLQPTGMGQPYVPEGNSLIAPDPYEEGYPKERVEIPEAHSLPAAYDTLEKGTKVVGPDGEIGHVDHLLADGRTEKITHLLVKRNDGKGDISIPLSQVQQIDKDRILVSGPVSVTPEIAGSPAERRMQARRPDEAQSRAQDRFIKGGDQPMKPWLKADAPQPLKDFGNRLHFQDFDLNELNAEFRGDTLYLKGVVPDVRARRHVHATAESISGVQHVQDDINIKIPLDPQEAVTTSLPLSAAVASALHRDPRTFLAIIDVTGKEDTVVLEGQVDSEEIRLAAEEIASRQQGVVIVINNLIVAPDEYTQVLNQASRTAATIQHI